jgi:nucleotide-binding universal stress UspA family protein
MKTILVPIDFSDASGRVVEMAASLAEAFGSQVILVHVWEPEPQFVGSDTGPLGVQNAVIGDPEDERQLEAFKKKFGLPAALTIHIEGSIPDEILNLAKEHEASLIVMGSHGHGALYQLFVGSVTTAVLKRAACPVLVVPSDRSHPGAG